MEWPADRVERRDVDTLLPYAQNARTHTPEQIEQIANSIAAFGFAMPVLVDEQGVLIAGHGRVLAARKLKLTQVPAMTAVGWSAKQVKAYRLADNKIALNSGWDDALLKMELSGLFADGFDLALTGFSELELEGLLAEPTAGLTDPDAVPPAPATPAARAGDVWLLGRHRLVCGDATSPEDVAAALGAVKPHLMVTDPPYGVDYDPTWRSDPRIATGIRHPKKGAVGEVANDERADWREAWALFPGTVAYVWTSGRYLPESILSLEAAGLERRALIIWAKSQMVLGRGHYHHQDEECWYAVRKGGTGNWQGDRTQTTLWQIAMPQRSETGHSTQKPVECMRRPIENNSSPGQAVYDPFCGSGTSIIAAEMTGRACHAIEINPAYIDVAIERWQDFTGQTAQLEESGEDFADVAAERADAAA